MGDWLIVMTIRLSMIGFAIGLSGQFIVRSRRHLSNAKRRSRPLNARLNKKGPIGKSPIEKSPIGESWIAGMWIGGLILFWIHVIVAMHFAHQWDHGLALENVREQTEQLIGWRIGIGLPINYLFGLLWTIDAGLMYGGGSPPIRSRYDRWRPLLIGFMLFMWINGGIVFASGFVRWLTVGLLLMIGISLVYVKVKSSRAVDGNDQD